MSEGRRDKILAAAERLFQHYGQRKTTMADIAREVGIGVGSLYLDFASKESLVSELAEARTRAVITAMKAAREGKASGRDRLEAMLVARVEALLCEAERGAHACEIVQCGGALKAGETLFGAEVRALLGEELERGEIAFGEARERALDVIEIAFGALSPPWLFKLPRARALELARGVASVVCRGVS